MTQEFHISVTPIRGNDYLVRTERVAPGVPLGEEPVTWAVDEWLQQARQLMNDPLVGLLRGEGVRNLSEMPGSPLDAGGGQPSASLPALGQQLYNALFQGTIRDSWMTAQGIAKHRHEVLRLRLGLKDDRLPRLPWEVLHNGDRPVATGTDVVFSRYHSSFGAITASALLQQMALWQPDQALKILMVLSAPTDQEVLALKQEALHLQAELQRNSRSGATDSRFSEIQVTILDQPGREQLTQALEHEHYHVLHYAGHSNLGNAGGNLYLVSNKTGLTETLCGDDLAGLLVNNGIRMAVFNSCRGVYTATSNPDQGEAGNLAEALVKRGILAVLAMAERIPDDVALNLSRLFYRNLKQSYPIDLSLNRARQGLISSYSSHQLYWALPILYMHPEFDGYLQPGTTEDSALNNEFSSDGTLAALDTPPPLDAATIAYANGLTPPPVDAVLSPINLATWEQDLTLDPDDLEFDDPEYTADLESVAALVKQLSQTTMTDEMVEPVLPALPAENLLPDADDRKTPDPYLPRVDSSPAPAAPGTPVRAFATTTATVAMPVATAAAPSVAVSEPQVREVYSELGQLLADSGKLTEAIAACNRAIEVNPNNAQAYSNLGQALQAQGYLTEAIAAYNQAIRINPLLATVHNLLGLALSQQGNLQEAIQAYNRAIQLDPTVTDAHRNLSLALHKQSMMNGTSFLVEQEASRTRTKFWQRAFWVGASTVGVLSLLAGMWTLYGLFSRSALMSPPLVQQMPIAAQNPNDLSKVSTNIVAALATEQLNQGNVRAAQKAIESLLDRGALAQVAAVLTPTLTKQADNPTINFLMGRLAWQSMIAGNPLYSLDDARRYWENATKQQSSAQYQTALGFAYYAEGKLERARKTWLRTLELAGEPRPVALSPATSIAQTPATRASAIAPEAISAYAGLALVSMKLAENQPPTRRAELLGEAINLRQQVLINDPINFQVDALSRNWMWTEQAIRDWQALLTLK